eukprot:CAMPEP_0197854198 /NCGR_PEP_ID=MMETSP1438-20131217/24209_1 /TAXON_ID=1461541 /ORGANISM="Pterosperma sp., Strain CCMP1384" /LENGTH=340 /DNA_ID=CAMNT_0043468851 /DNA_START=57 /DNA_END=1079 /DNA_ORIENTATION=-
MAITKNSGSVSVVVGGGRVGTYLACKLTKAGGRVVLKGRPGSKSSQLKIYSDLLCKEAGVQQTTSYDTIAAQTVDFLFIATKTYDFQNVKRELEAANVTVKNVILIHNGILKPIFKDSVRVVVTQSWDFHETPGEGVGVKMVVRNEDKPWAMPDTPNAKEVAELLGSVGINASASKEFEFMMVKKYFINGVANLQAIIGDCNCNGLLADHRNTMELLYDEIHATLRNVHKQAFADMPPNFRQMVFDGLATYGPHYPSTKMDFDAGLNIELDALNGYIIEMAKEQGIKVPHTEALVSEVKRRMSLRKSSTSSAGSYNGRLIALAVVAAVGAVAASAIARRR